MWLDHAKLKVAKEVKPGEEFEYVFDLGDNWRHRCTVEAEKGDPLEEYGIVPKVPARSGVGDGSPTSTADRPSISRMKRTSRADGAQAASLRWQTTAQPSSMNAMCSSGSRS